MKEVEIDDLRRVEFLDRFAEELHLLVEVALGLVKGVLDDVPECEGVHGKSLLESQMHD